MDDPPGGNSSIEAAPGLVSVVVNFLNAAPYLREAIDSVNAQSYADWELLLVDDGSDDDGTRIGRVAAARDPARVRYLEHPGHRNLGASASRNLGIARARGEFVAFLDADDVWLSHRLARSVALLRSNPSADMVYGRSEYWRSWAPGGGADRIQPHGIRADRVVHRPELLVMHLTRQAALPCVNSITARRAALRRRGGWVDSFRGMHDDQAFLARFCLHHDVFVSSECWDRYRQHDASICATSARRGDVKAAREAYLSWLHGYLGSENVTDKRIWRAFRDAERAHALDRPGWRARVARWAFGAWRLRYWVTLRRHTASASPNHSAKQSRNTESVP